MNTSREITTHLVPGAPDNVRVLATDDPDHEKGGGACHSYRVRWSETRKITIAELEDILNAPSTNDVDLGDLGSAVVSFQHGPLKEAGSNGLTNESLIAIVLDRLGSFQAGPFRCRDNALAITHLEDALMRLQRRTLDRVARGVEGENKA